MFPDLTHLPRRFALALLLTFLTLGSVLAIGGGVRTAARDLPWPDRRFAPCGALDPEPGVLYAFGGRADDGVTHLGDLWSLDLGLRRGTRPSWTLAADAAAPAAPPSVRSCAAAWDPTGRRLLVFGGLTTGGATMN
ncbi:MAG: hypothetical protein ACRDZ2_05545, partial [Ilumatobacteraceae bacterium]